jgi:PAS domain S-box-containing protein
MKEEDHNRTDLTSSSTALVDPSITYISEISADSELDRAALDQLAEPVIVVDESMKIVRVNKEAEIITGYTRLDLLGKPIESLVPEARHHVHRGHTSRYMTYPQARQMGVHLDVELILVTHAKKEVPVKISLKPLVISRGRFVSAVIRLRDEVRG